MNAEHTTSHEHEGSSGQLHPPCWVLAVDLAGSVAFGVLDGVRRDLANRKLRWGVTAVGVVGSVALGLLKQRYPRPSSSRDADRVRAALKQARQESGADYGQVVSAVLHDPGLVAARRRLAQTYALAAVVGVASAVGQRLLGQEMTREGTRWPHLKASLVFIPLRVSSQLGTLEFACRHRGQGDEIGQYQQRDPVRQQDVNGFT